MERRKFNKRLFLGTLGVGTIPLWSNALVPFWLPYERIDIGGPKEHVRHGALDLFSSSGPPLTKNASIKIDRHIFYKNGFSASNEDPLFVHIEYGSKQTTKRVLLQVERNEIKVVGSDQFIGSEISPTSIYSDDSVEIERLNKGNVELEKGDIILALKGAVIIDGDPLSNNEVLCVRSRTNVNCKMENAVLVLIRSTI